MNVKSHIAYAHLLFADAVIRTNRTRVFENLPWILLHSVNIDPEFMNTSRYLRNGKKRLRVHFVLWLCKNMHNAKSDVKNENKLNATLYKIYYWSEYENLHMFHCYIIHINICVCVCVRMKCTDGFSVIVIHSIIAYFFLRFARNLYDCNVTQTWT